MEVPNAPLGLMAGTGLEPATFRLQPPSNEQWTNKAIMVLWRESLQKLKFLGRHFMTNQTFKDTMTAIDGLVLYIIDCVKYEAEIVPWFLSSDSLEQLFSWLRVGRYEGRRTNLDYLTVVQGAGKSNPLLPTQEDEDF